MVNGLVRFSATMGGLPTVTEIIFLKQDYDYSSADGRLVPRPDVGASFAAGSVLVVEKGTRGRFVAGRDACWARRPTPPHVRTSGTR
jgi:hypothetical protein